MAERKSQGNSQYDAIKTIPLIKSPTLYVPKPIDVPQDIHPLPPDIQEYFRYPFTLEPHVLTLESSRRATMAAHASRREATLRSRDEEKERRKREALRKVAPGFEPSKGVLMPTAVHPKAGNNVTSPGPSGGVPPPPKSAMEELVDQLEALDARSSKKLPS